MVIAVKNAIVNAGKLSSAADVSVCRKKIAAKVAGALISGAWAMGSVSVENAVSEVSIL